MPGKQKTLQLALPLVLAALLGLLFSGLPAPIEEALSTLTDTLGRYCC